MSLRSPGYYTTSSWPGALPQWGATATSLSCAGGLMTLRELRAGVIDHALAIALPAPRAGRVCVARAAQRRNGRTEHDSGGCEASAGSAASISAASRYPPYPDDRDSGAAIRMIVRDQTHAGSACYAEDPTQLRRRSAVLRPARIFGGQTPQQLLAKFPVEPPPGHEASGYREPRRREWRVKPDHGRYSRHICRARRRPYTGVLPVCVVVPAYNRAAHLAALSAERLGAVAGLPPRS